MPSRSLPERPDLDQLRRQAKELKDSARAGDPTAVQRLSDLPLTLSSAQLVIAREHGFPSWPALHAHVEAHLADLAERVELFLRASVGGPIIRAATLLHEYPEIAAYDFRTAIVLGDITRVRQFLADDPELALRPGDRGWPPLLGVCSSRWHRDPNRADGMLAIAQLLLDAGADPNTRVDAPGPGGHCSTLFGAAGCANNPALTRLLLERGAIPDDHTLYLAAFFTDHECLRLLLPYADLSASTAIVAPISSNDIEGVRLLLDAGVNPSLPLPADLFGDQYAGQPPVGAVAEAIESQCDIDLITLLLDRGADPDQPGRNGCSPYRLAVRRGRPDIADLLVRHGCRDDATDADRLLAACLRADRREAFRLVDNAPGLVAALTDTERAAIVHAADAGDTEAVRLMLDLGFGTDARSSDDDGATALHTAAASGSAQTASLLIARGADLEAPDTTYQSAPLDWAIVGSGMHLGHNPAPDWVATVRVLIEAGASTASLSWGEDKPPSAEVAEFVRGIGPAVH
jgi:ankyrin repeat protein